jgi:hypothetical protein
MTDPYGSPEFKKFERLVKSGLYPKIANSAVGISLVPSKEPDVKFCIELGAMIMYDKPIILVVAPGSKVPERLVRLADAIIEGDINSDEAQHKLIEAIERVTEEVDDGKPQGQ